MGEAQGVKRRRCARSDHSAVWGRMQDFVTAHPGRAGAVVSRAIGPPVGSLHAAQAVLLPGSSCGVCCDQRKAREGKRGKGAVGGVLLEGGKAVANIE